MATRAQRNSVSSLGTSTVKDAQQTRHLVKLLHDKESEKQLVDAAAQTEKSQRPAKIRAVKGFCERRGVPVLALGDIKRDVFVTHEQRKALHHVEMLEAEYRSDLAESCFDEYRDGFTYLALALRRMHEERVATHAEMLAVEASTRERFERVELQARVPISHARCAAEYNNEYLQQILKRGSILEDDMLRERKFTSREEAQTRSALQKAMLEDAEAVRRKLSEHIRFANIQAASFAKAAAAFHAAVFDLSGAVPGIQIDQDVRHTLLLGAPESPSGKRSGPGDVDDQPDDDDDPACVAAGPLTITPFVGTTRHRIQRTVEIQDVLASKPARFSKKRLNEFANASEAQTPQRDRSSDPTPVSTPPKQILLTPMSVSHLSSSRSRHRSVVAPAFRKQWWLQRSEMEVLMAEMRECQPRDAQAARLPAEPSVALIGTRVKDSTAARTRLGEIRAALVSTVERSQGNDQAAQTPNAPSLEGQAGEENVIALLIESSALLAHLEEGDAATHFAVNALQRLRDEANASHYAVRSTFFGQAVAALYNLALSCALSRQPRVPDRHQDAESVAKLRLTPLDVLHHAQALSAAFFGDDHPLTSHVAAGVPGLLEAHTVPSHVRRAKRLPGAASPAASS